MSSLFYILDNTIIRVYACVCTDDVQESKVLQKRSGQHRLYNENLISLVAALVVTLRGPIPGCMFWVPRLMSFVATP